MLCEFSLSDDIPNSTEQQTAIQEQFNNFMQMAYRMKEENDAGYVLFNTGKRDNLNFWLTEGGHQVPKLKVITSRVFSLIASTGSVERVNSSMLFVHSKLRNALKDPMVTKLVYIKCNHTTELNTLLTDLNQGEEDCDEEEDEDRDY